MARAGASDAIHDLAESIRCRSFRMRLRGCAAGRSWENLLPYGGMVFQLVRAALRSVFEQSALATVRCSGARLDFRSMQAQRRWRRRASARIDHGAAVPTPARSPHRRGGSAGARALLTAGLDTTVVGLGTTIHACASHPTNGASAALDRRC